MKTIYQFTTLLMAIGLMALNFAPGAAPAAAPAVGLEVSPQVIRGPDLVIWEGPPREGPSIQVPATERRDSVALQSSGLVFDVDWGGSWPPAAQAAFTYALNLWSAELEDTGVTVTISATWRSLGVSGPLGQGGPTLGYCESGCPYNYTLYPEALLNKLAGYNVFPANYDISTTYNSDKASDFYFGLDGNPSNEQSDFVTVVLHEVGHGLGLIGGMWVDAVDCGLTNKPLCYCEEVAGQKTGCLKFDLPFIYDIFTEDFAGTKLLDHKDNSIALKNALQSNTLYFDGTNTNAGNGGGRVPIYAPNTWAPGSSYSHLDYSIFYGTSNSLMTYMLTDGDSFHNPGPVTLGIFEDIGWGVLPENYVYIPVVVK